LLQVYVGDINYIPCGWP